MSDIRNIDIDDLYDMENGVEKEKLLNRIIKDAVAQKDLDREYQARTELMRNIAFTEQPEKVIALFPWLLAMNDKHPGRFSLWQVLWYYKWAVIRMAKFPQISKQRIMDVMSDMKQRYEAGGFGTKTIVYFMRSIYLDLGMPEEAKKQHELWLTMDEFSFMSDCPACVTNALVKYKVKTADYAGAIVDAQKLVSKEQTCAEVPQRTYASIMYAHMKEGEMDEAKKMYNEAMNALKDEDVPLLVDFGYIILYLTMIKDYVSAKESLIRELPKALTFNSPYEVDTFYTCCMIFLKTLQQNGHTEMALPQEIDLPVKHENGNYKISDLYAFFEKETQKIIASFNTRNGNDYYTERQANLMAILD